MRMLKILSQSIITTLLSLFHIYLFVLPLRLCQHVGLPLILSLVVSQFILSIGIFLSIYIMVGRSIDIDRLKKRFPRLIMIYFVNLSIKVFSNCLYEHWHEPLHITFWSFIRSEIDVFVYLLCLDLIYYPLHKACHLYPFLFRHVHKLHHSILHPEWYETTYASIWEHLFMNLPSYIFAHCICCHVPLLSIILANARTTHDEIYGHSGTQSHGSLFILLNFPLKNLGLLISTPSHALHHKVNNYNYCKQFTIFDKVFNTFREGRRYPYDSSK